MAERKYTHVPVLPRTLTRIKRLQKIINKTQLGKVTQADAVEIAVSEMLTKNNPIHN